MCGLGVGAAGMAADAVVVLPRDQQALLGPRAAAERDAQQRDQFGQARPQQVGDAGRAEHRGALACRRLPR